MSRKWSLLKSGLLCAVPLTLAMACGGGGESTTQVASTTTKNTTGNKAFDVNTYKAKDPLANYRTDLVFGSQKPRFKAALPSSVNHGAKVPNAGNQGLTGSCSAWSAAYFKSWQESVEEGWDAKSKMFSPMYLFAMQCREHSKFGSSAPYSDELSAAILKAYGCCLESTLPYVDYKHGENPSTENDAKEKAAYSGHTISAVAHDEARKYKSGDKFTDFHYYDEASSTWKLKYDVLKETVAKMPVMLGIANFEGPVGNTAEENYFTPKSAATGHGGGHAILCIGYDDSKFGTGAWLTRNSWGQDSGEKGDTWIKYTDQASIIQSAMTIKDLPNANPAKVEAKPASPTGLTATTTRPEITLNWNKISTARYYKVYRKAQASGAKYTYAGKTDINKFVDYPKAGSYLYLVTSVNGRGESSFLPNDGTEKGYVSLGTSVVEQTPITAKPTLAVLNSNSRFAQLSVTGIDSVDTSTHFLHVLVAGNPQGPWASMGHIKIVSPIMVNWEARSELVGDSPHIKMALMNTLGQTGPFSNIAKTEKVAPDTTGLDENETPKTVSGLVAQANSDGTVSLTWSASTSGNVDYYIVSVVEKDPETGYEEETELDAVEETSYLDDEAMPGFQIKYTVTPVSAGLEGTTVTSDSVRVAFTDGNPLELIDYNFALNLSANTITFSDVKIFNMGDADVGASKINVEVKVYSYSLADELAEDDFDEEELAGEEDDVAVAFATTTLSGDLVVGGGLATYTFTLNIPDSFRRDDQIHFWELSVYEEGMEDSASVLESDMPWIYGDIDLGAFELDEDYDDGDGDDEDIVIVE